MFKKILIANRGEIACRIIKTARRMGIQTVAVFSDADARARHVEMADEAVNIGPAPAAQSYLAIGKIIAACEQTRAEAVHPGYGFLSERLAFAQALQRAGITFIGPHAQAIEAMGDKIASKAAAAAAGVSTVPGHLGSIASADEAVRIAEDIGYPVILKASAGGGGKGMRIAHNQAETYEGFAVARAEAAAAFGDDRLFIEKFIINPRHIEIQVLGDKHGHVIHLGDRECSVQRRNQKVIEEAPSPLLSEETRRQMQAQAVALAKAVHYDSAGTVEFVAGQDQSFYFLEMNTRLQVEHPVTELVTGIDLVEQMIRVAAGQALSITQDDVKIRGWAVEARVYAEDPYRGFLPSTGRLVRYRPPTEESGSGVTVRNDTGVYEGGEISVWYDPMIAKLCTHAATRAEAIAAMSKALDQFVITGIRHNAPFLSAIMGNRRWQAGALSTAFIEEEFPGGFHGATLDEKTADMLADVAISLDHEDKARRRTISGQMNGSRMAFERKREVRLGNLWRTVELKNSENPEQAQAGQSVWQVGQPLITLDTRHGPITVQVEPILNGYRLRWRGIEVDAQVFTPREAAFARRMPVAKTGLNAKMLRCPMPGLVVSLAVAKGQAVKAGDTLAVIEAMKMQNILRAERDGVIKSVKAKAGDSLNVDAVIIEFE